MNKKPEGLNRSQLKCTMTETLKMIFKIFQDEAQIDRNSGGNL